jgi:hypothetical protein
LTVDFTTEELFDAIDKVVRELLDRHDTVEPPVDAVRLVEGEFDYVTREAEPEDDEPEMGRFGPRPPARGRRREVVFRPDQSEEARHAACARACAKELIPRVLHRLGVTPSPDHRPATSQLVGLVAPRLLLPTRWFERDASKSGYDLEALKHRYSTVGYELLLLRFLDLEEPCVITVVDDGAVGTRRSNRYPVNRTLTEAERRCQARVAEEDEPARVRYDGWTAWGWPARGGAFRRILLRSQPDEV